MKKKLASLLIFGLTVTGAFSGTLAMRDDAAVAKGLALFDQARPRFAPVVAKNAEFLRKLVGRYLGDETMTASECELAEATLEAIGFYPGDLATRGKDLASLLDDAGGGSSAPANPVKSSGATKSGKGSAAKMPVEKKPVEKKLVVQKNPVYSDAGKEHVMRISGLHAAAKVTVVEHRIPGGQSMASVVLNVGERRKKVFEVAASNKLSAQSRAKTIADRVVGATQKDKLWWMKLERREAENGEIIVAAPSVSDGYVVTADRRFAKECGMSREALADHIIRRIKNTYDGHSASRIGGRSFGEDEVDARTQAIDARQLGDDLLASSAQKAEAAYRDAVRLDPSYTVAHLRLIQCLLDRKDAVGAREAARAALQTPGLAEEDRREILRLVPSAG